MSTASSAMISQDVDVYAFMADAVFLYNAQKHLLKLKPTTQVILNHPVGYVSEP